MTSRRHYEGLPSGALDKAKALRRNATDAEKHLWRGLREKLSGTKWRRQVPHGAYVADFLCFSARLIVEVDGATHAESIEQDAARTCYFEAQGYQVLRFWNHEVMDNIDGVVAVIAARLSPSPSHA